MSIQLPQVYCYKEIFKKLDYFSYHFNDPGFIFKEGDIYSLAFEYKIVEKQKKYFFNKTIEIKQYVLLTDINDRNKTSTFSEIEFKEHFWTLDEYREKQINQILE